MWLVPCFMNKPANKALKNLLHLRNPGRIEMEGTLTSCCDVVNHLIAEDSHNEIIDEMVSEMKLQTNQSTKKN